MEEVRSSLRGSLRWHQTCDYNDLQVVVDIGAHTHTIISKRRVEGGALLGKGCVLQANTGRTSRLNLCMRSYDVTNRLQTAVKVTLALRWQL